MRLSKILAASLFACLAMQAARVPVLIGTANDVSCLPLSCNMSNTSTGQSIQYQQVYTSSVFSGPEDITSLTFYDNYAVNDLVGINGGPVINGIYQISLSTTAKTLNLSTNPNNNIGPDNTVVFTGNLAQNVPCPPCSFTITDGLGFNYDPSKGYLLMNITVTNQDNVCFHCGGRFDADDTGSQTTQAFTYAFGTVSDTAGLVTGFDVPEPASLLLMGAGLAGLALSRKKLMRRSR